MSSVQQLAKGVVKQHGVNSGRPSIEGTWTPVWALVSRFVAGDSVDSIAEDYEISVESVIDAIRYELGQHPISS